MAVNAQQYFSANPDIAQQYASNNYGMTPQQFADFHYQNYGQYENRRLSPNAITSAQLKALNENVQKYGTQDVSIANTEQGGIDVNLRDLGQGFNAYKDESGQISGFTRVDPAKPGMIQLYGPNGEYRGEEKITTTTQDLLKNLGPIALAAGGTALAQGLLGSSLFGGAGALEAGGTAFDLANAGIAGGTASFTPAQLALIESGASAAQVAATGTGAGLLSGAAGNTAANTATSALTNTAANTALTTVGAKTAAELAAEELAKKTATSVLVNEVTKKLNPDAVSGLLQTGGSLLQSKESKAAAEQAARDITAATQAGVTGSQFRPVGMTSRFGTSQFKYDPVTGQMTSAGYQLTPEAKAQQDRFATMANYSLTQAENAQSQFNPLQAGAANLFTLGNKYIEKTPESVAQTYIDQQMALLKPSREVELANLQNRLQQQGRLGLSVAQGGTLGATTPELQALYNARAQQEAVLAANAQQAGQQSVLFGAGLLGQGTNALNQYYGGQVAAYQPYQAAMGQVQNLESLGQQPLQMGATLGQQSSAAGARAGQLGIQGQQLSSAYNTGANATFNPYAGLLTAAGSPSSMFGQSIAKYLSGGSVTPFDALSSTKYGDGLAGYEKMIADIYGT
jgi:uncharacterized membrane protein